MQEFSRRHAEYYRGLLEGIENDVARRDRRLLPTSTMFARHWNGASAPTAALRSASGSPPPPRRFSWRCRCSPNAIAGRSEQYLLSTTPLGAAARRCICRRALAFRRCRCAAQSDAARAALSRSLAIAEARGEVLNQVGLLGMLSMFEVRDGDFKTSLHYAQLSRAVDGTAENSRRQWPWRIPFWDGRSSLSASMAILALELEASFRYWSRSRQTSEVYLGLDHHILVGIGLARNLWFQGHPAQATERVRQTIKDAERKNHPASLGLALSWAPGIFLWIGDLQSAEEHADWLISHAESHSLATLSRRRPRLQGRGGDRPR